MEGIAASSRVEVSSNPFEILNTLEDPFVPVNDRDQQPLSIVIEETKAGIILAHLGSPARVSSPFYTNMMKKKPLESFGSSEDETFKRPSKKAGRKSLREAREEEAKRRKMQGSQTTLEMSIGRNTRARPPKGGLSNSIPNR